MTSRAPLVIVLIFVSCLGFALNPSHINTGVFPGEGNDYASLWSDPNFNFSNQGTDLQRKVHIHLEAGETFYYGFAGKQNTNWAVTDPVVDGFSVQLVFNGGVVYGPQVISRGGQGWINDFPKNVAGPQQLGNPSGYNAYSYVAAQSGDYIIEFVVPGNISFWMPRWDMTIVDALGDQKTGRIWSQDWHVAFGSNRAHVTLHQFVYTQDRVVYEIEEDGWERGVGGHLLSNDHGPVRTGNLGFDRQSQTRANVIATPAIDRQVPQHRIFFEAPDPSIFSYATPQDVYADFSNQFLSGCTGNYFINITSDKAVQVEIKLDLDGVPGFQSGGRDRLLIVALQVGDNPIPWDGRDGLGDLVPGLSFISYEITQLPGVIHYFVGHQRTNMPSAGFTVQYLNPGFFGTLDLFWDDRQLPTPANVDNSANPCTGTCHTWGTYTGLAGIYSFNTWWFLPSTSEIYQAQLAASPEVDIINGDTTVCPGSLVELIATGAASDYSWESPLGNVLSTSSLNYTATPLATQYYYFVYSGPCGSDMDSVLITIGGAGGAAGTIDQVADVCEPGDVTLSLTGNSTSQVQWQINRVGFMDTLSIGTPQNLTGIPAGVYDFRAVVGTGSCQDISSPMQFTVHPAPVVLATPIDPYCSGESSFILSSASPAGGTYSGIGVSNNRFDPASATIGTNTITYSYTDAGSGCSASVDFDVVVIGGYEAGTITGISQLCAPASATLTVNGNSSDTMQWQINRSGFVDTLSSENPLSIDSLSNGSHEFRVIVGDGVCADTSESLIITVIGNKPELTVSPIGPFCSSESGFELTNASPAGGTYSGIGVSGNDFVPGDAQIGINRLTYTYTDTSTFPSCSTSIDFDVEVVESPEAGSMVIVADLIRCAPFTDFLMLQGNSTNSIQWQINRSGYVDTLSGNNPEDLIGLPVGVYDFRAVVGDGMCTDTSENLVYEVFDRPLVTAVPIGPYCDNEGDVVLTNGTPSGGIYTGPGVSSGVFSPSGVGEGDYSINYHYVDPFSGCSSQIDFDIVVNESPVAGVLQPINDLCSPGQGELRLSGNSGFLNQWQINRGGYTDTLIRDVPINPQPFTGLPAGSYDFRAIVYDGICSDTTSPMIFNVVAAPIIGGVLLVDPTDCDNDDGIISIDAFGPNGELVYSVDRDPRFQNDSTFRDLSPINNPYRVTVQYDNGTCQTSGGDHELTEMYVPLISELEIVNPTDCNNNNGSITVSASGVSGALEYSIDGGVTYQDSPEFTGLSSSNNPFEVRVHYTTQVCEVQGIDVELQAPIYPSLGQVQYLDPTTCAADDGMIDISQATGPSGQLEYSINGGDSFHPSPIFTGLTAPATHHVVIRYINGTCELSGDFVISLDAEGFPEIDSVVTTDPISCSSPDGSLIIYGSGDDILQYSINDGANFSDSHEFEGLSSGSYSIVVSYVDGQCRVNGPSVILLQPTDPELEMQHVAPVCISLDAFELNFAFPAGGVYSGPGVVDGYFDPAMAGEGQFNIVYTYQDAQTGCDSEGTSKFVVRPLPTIDVAEMTCVKEDEGVVHLENVQPTGGVFVGKGVTQNGDFDPGLIDGNVVDLRYTFVDPETGCWATVEFEIYVKGKLRIPNAFTPNGDGSNDEWRIEGLDAYPKSIIRVYNRWGNLVWENYGGDTFWTGGDYPVGTYYYMIYTGVNGEVISGDCSIVR